LLTAAGGKILPTSINVNGTISGNWISSNLSITQTKPVIYQSTGAQFLDFTPSGSTTDYTFGYSVAINNLASVLGVFQSPLDNSSYFFVRSVAGVVVPFTSPYVTNITAVNGLNNGGTVLSTVTDPTTGFLSGRLLEPVAIPAYPATLPAGTPLYTAQDLGSATGYNTYTVAALNDNQQVIGTLYPSAVTDPGQAFLWSGGTFTTLAALAPGQPSRALCINQAGVIGGGATDANNNEQPVLWQAGKVTTLPLLTNATDATQNATHGFVVAVNDGGDAVGIVIGNVLGRVAVYWHAGTVVPLGQLTDSTLGVTFSDVYGINNSGTILAFGRNTQLGTAGYYVLTHR
jgi:hypothetical protein